jgi:L-alanine-DL-glutamate epimerase-like enolase superfamily enzyme
MMKSGGLTEAMRMIHTAKACNLQVMFGCYSDSAIANTAAAQLSPLADYLAFLLCEFPGCGEFRETFVLENNAR